MSEKKLRDQRDVADNIARTLVAFANADGGELLIGVEDDGTITGHQFSIKQQEYLLKVPETHIHNDTPLHGVKCMELTINNEKILYFNIEKSHSIHQTSDGKCLQRKDIESVPVAFVTLQIERSEALSREYDRQYLDGALVNDLNTKLMQSISNNVTRNMSCERMLQFLDLADYSDTTLKLRRAALLLFANDITKWHPRCEVRVLRIKGNEILTGKEYNITSDEKVTGNIIELMAKAWEKIRIHLVQQKLHGEGLFIEHIMYPEDACREALTNAIAHRDYNIEGRGIEVLVYDDKMVFKSPGELLSSIRVSDLVSQKGVHQSRNTRIARVLKEIGYMREMGEGIRRIFSLMEEKELVKPIIESSSSEFSITLSHKSVYSEEDQTLIQSYWRFNLTQEEIGILLICKNGKVVSPNQIFNFLKLSDWDEYRRIITNMQFKGILYTTMNASDIQNTMKRKRITKREVSRLSVRDHKEGEINLNELIQVISVLGSFETVTNNYFNQVKKSLSDDNIYKDPHKNLINLLKLLSFVDDENHPTSKLVEIWKLHATPKFKTKEKPLPPISKTLSDRDIYVENVEYHTSEDELKEIFEKFGIVDTVTIPKDYYTTLGRGFAFIKMKFKEDADMAMRSLDNSIYKGREISVSFSNRSKTS